MTERSAGSAAKTLYAVSRGQYSDYSVMCVCDTERRAKEVAAAYNGDPDSSRYDDAFVEPILYLDHEPRRYDVLSRQENIWDDGTTTDLYERRSTEWEFNVFYPESLRPVSWRWVRAPMHKNKGGRLEVRGIDHERVNRTFSDMRARLLAGDALAKREDAHG